MIKQFVEGSSAGLMPLGMKWDSTCCWKWSCDSLTWEKVAQALFVVFVGFLLVVALVIVRINYHPRHRRRRRHIRRGQWL